MLNHFVERTWAQIDLSAIAYNYNAIKNSVNKNTKIICVIKADGYGHGAVPLAHEYQKLGADWFAVSNIEEAMQLRQNDITLPILILGYTPERMVNILAENNISQTIYSTEYGKKIAENAKKIGVTVNIHIKIDTGMSRIGFMCQDIERDKNVINEIAEICNLNNINPQGIFTHFAVSDEGENGQEATLNQYNCFKFVTNSLSNIGINFEIKHCANSGAILDYKGLQLDAIRAGIILYGLQPSAQVRNKLSLKPAMELKSVISHIKTVEKGVTVSYGRTYKTDKLTKIATVPIGYADGYSRSFSDKAYMIVNSKRARVIGRVCMDQLMLDVSHIDNVKVGDIVTVFGGNFENTVTADELANIMNSINYEITCNISKRVPRVYYKDNNLVEISDCICPNGI